MCFLPPPPRCNWPRGKVMGGSSVLNYMLYVRGNRRDYDYWEALGNHGWGFDTILHYFKKSEDNRNPYIARNLKYHGTGGYLTVQEAPRGGRTRHRPLFHHSPFFSPIPHHHSPFF
ncbi:putative glucose dehydrogenase [Penaeus vannamei]|uniref:Putative glucose dehydrogenase n=1 Tax=Penaeus vannamei TaxID=6689 RepID=A0A3R7QY38_PENVA|nr:putative glucose dehydrogenase [Penaeus vannamei]